MSMQLLPRPPRGALRVAALCTALVLTACGSGSDAPRHDPPPTAGTPTTPAFGSDSFFDYVAARVYSLIDDGEPEATDGVTATTPEDTEPKPVG
ncbi:hypothetical protein [Massilia litorea]|uniref:Lipoprotein n=1 Tax=Massilia litorea TaxID=2769491 RepID=A0A7L9U9M6_9BURK|nr:hypothetical protein [Massilia litorea]QOL51540.1 hypothetical protein LPB04_09940 [Massilia litorea]